MKYRTCPACGKAKVKPIRVDIGEHFVDHLVECPKCDWCGCQTEFIEEMDPTQLDMFGGVQVNED